MSQMLLFWGVGVGNVPVTPCTYIFVVCLEELVCFLPS